MLAGLVDRVRRRRPIPVWYDGRYRLPLGVLEQRTLEPRRADFALWALRRAGVLDLRRPPRISFADLARVHAPAYLESLLRPETLARIFAVDASEIAVDAVLDTARLACGATLAAARASLATGAATLNLLGGFHHAAPARGGGLCPVNDIAVAVAALRHDGFTGQICVIDLDAHPPDGTAECLRGDGRAWIGSLSASDWGAVAGADEVLLPAGCADPAYLHALRRLLARMPRPALAFVVAGGDVLAGDRMGRLGLTLAGARERDATVLRALEGLPSVWLPGGGYHDEAWKVLAGTGLVLAGRARAPLPRGEPLSSFFAEIGAAIDPSSLGLAFGAVDAAEIEAELFGRPREPRLLGAYPASGLEHALHAYGVLAYLERLGYGDVRVGIEPSRGVGDRVTVRSGEHLVIDTVLARRTVAERDVLYVNWLSLRHPRAHFVAGRGALPGQEVPGLGLAREVFELFARIADRLGLGGVAYRPSWYHTAYVARRRLQFVDAARQGRFEALIRDLYGVDLAEATRAIAAGEVELDGAPYAWEADVMITPVPADPGRAAAVAAARDRAHFRLAAGERRRSAAS